MWIWINGGRKGNVGLAGWKFEGCGAHKNECLDL